MDSLSEDRWKIYETNDLIQQADDAEQRVNSPAPSPVPFLSVRDHDAQLLADEERLSKAPVRCATQLHPSEVDDRYLATAAVVFGDSPLELDDSAVFDLENEDF